MTLTLTVESGAWNRRVDDLAARIDGLVPVVKGNGYGFGRSWLAERAALLAPIMAVGTVFEVPSVPSNYSALVLTPALHLPADLRPNAIVTVGSSAHVAAASEHGPRRVVVKVRSSMHRYGVPVSEIASLVEECRRAHLDIAGVSIHPPLHGTSADHAKEIATLAAELDPAWPLWISHVDEAGYEALRTDHPDREWHLRLGTALWHGDKSELTLSTDVVDVVTMKSDGIAGYRGMNVSRGSRLVILGCGSAHGVSPLADGRSPFHFQRRRLALLEPPHMHTSMCVVASSDECPDIGDSIDVQRPLTTTFVDVTRWI